MKKPKTHHYVRTKVALARRLGISRVTLDNYLTHPAAPECAKGKGYDLAAVTDFIAEYAVAESTRTKASEELKSLKAKEVSLKCDRLKFKLDTERGEFVRRDDVAEALTKSMIPIRETLRRALEDQLPIAMTGLGVSEARIAGKKIFDEICQRFEAEFRSWQ